MPIDKETFPTFINVVLDDTPKHLKKMREQAEEDFQNDSLSEGEAKKMSFTVDGRNIVVDEYYFEDGCIYYSSSLDCNEGKGFFSFEIPLSDKVLIDVLEYSTKKLNKLKTALETLK